MIIDVESSALAKPPTLPAPLLRPARLEDYDAIARLGLANLSKPQPAGDWRRMWLDNPLWPRLGKEWHIGWVLETAAGDIAGSVLNIPSMYSFRGSELICGNGRAWSAAPAYRGYALWLMDEYFNQASVDLFINTTVGPNAAPMIDRLSARIPMGDWATSSTWVTGHVEFARQRFRLQNVPFAGLFAHPAGGVLWLKHAFRKKPLSKSPRSVVIEVEDRFDSRFDVFWRELLHANSDILLSERTSSALSWHFGIPMRRRGLWIFTASRNGQLRAYCIVIRTADGRQAHFIDYQTVEPDTELLPLLLQAALTRCADENVYLLRNLGHGVPKMRALDDSAPYRNDLSNWRFYYRAADPTLDTTLRDARFWDPSAYDGDASFK
jgi:hypothetical protein